MDNVDGLETNDSLDSAYELVVEELGEGDALTGLDPRNINYDALKSMTIKTRIDFLDNCSQAAATSYMDDITNIACLVDDEARALDLKIANKLIYWRREMMNAFLYYVESNGVVSIVNGKKEPSQKTPAAFKTDYNLKVVTGVVYKEVMGGKFERVVYRSPASKDWLEWKHRRNYSTTEYLPSGKASEEGGVLNLFKGFPHEAVKGEEKGEQGLKHILEFCRNIICAENEEQFEFLMDWVAHFFHYPDTKPKSAIVLTSGDREQVGKNVFSRP